jgi:hypothetical protein
MGRAGFLLHSCWPEMPGRSFGAARPSPSKEATVAFGIIASVPAPLDMYRAVNAQITEQTGDAPPDGLLVHIARETADGFQVIEVWESKQQCERFEQTVLAPIIDRVSGGQAPARSDVTEEFEVQNLFVGARAAEASSP